MERARRIRTARNGNSAGVALVASARGAGGGPFSSGSERLCGAGDRPARLRARPPGFGGRGVTPLSSDLLRNILFDDVEEQRYQGLVFSTLRSLLRARLIARMPWNYVDATNLSIHERRQWIKMAKSFGYEVQAVFFDVPLEVCLERNRQRDRSVSEDVMRKMAEKLKPPVFEEGFAKITVVRVKSAGGAGESPMSTPAPQTPYVEPWLRGTHAEVPAVGRAVLHALDLALDDLPSGPKA